MGSANDSEMYLFEADWEGIKSKYQAMAMDARVVSTMASLATKDLKVACMELAAKITNLALTEIKQKMKIKV